MTASSPTGELVTTRESSRSFLLAALVISAAGLYCFALYINRLIFTWTDDGLMSIGMLVPPAAAWLCWRAWRGHAWNRGRDGTWWGLALMVAAIAVGRLTNPASAGLWITPQVEVGFPPFGVLLFAYVSGAVLFLGGLVPWRKAVFPLCLLLLVKPVPGFFQAMVDLPLQRIAAETARGFASLLGMSLSGQNLDVMFTPTFGMFIAPGCNGLRGSIAMGFLALIIGHLYRLRPFAHASFVAGAIVLGYVLNLMRLCGLVLFYWLALRVEPLAPHSEAADYVIGAILFFTAAAFLFGVPRPVQHEH